MNLSGRTILLLEPSVDERLTAAQAQTYQMLQALGDGFHYRQELMMRLNLKHWLPLESRLKHLQQKGFLIFKQ